MACNQTGFKYTVPKVVFSSYSLYSSFRSSTACSCCCFRPAGLSQGSSFVWGLRCDFGNFLCCGCRGCRSQYWWSRCSSWFWRGRCCRSIGRCQILREEIIMLHLVVYEVNNSFKEGKYTQQDFFCRHKLFLLIYLRWSSEGSDYSKNYWNSSY